MRDPPHTPTAPRVVEPPNERPEELDDAREQLAKVSEHDQEEWDADDGVDDGGDTA